MSTVPDILSQPYPSPCPFCAIADALPYPAAQSSPSTDDAHYFSAESSTPRSGSTTSALLSCVPAEEELVAGDLSPRCFPVLAASAVIAFLDIMPMTRGHLLVATRRHRATVGELESGEGTEVGFWLPVLARIVAKVTGQQDYNVVQNNGVRAAQVVPHVHFHIIPRPVEVREVRSQSWTMFGRGQREDLDDEDGEALAVDLRDELRRELRRMSANKSMI